jgi:glyoxylase-like metal-dependent hydrolase (beta-lactamase superfamily II)
MAEVIVLRPGYAFVDRSDKLRAGATVSLVIADVRIIVDTGGPAERAAIIASLARHDLRPEQIQTERGVVAIAGDVFENGADVHGDTWIPFSRDPQRQRRSRAEILSLADFIVPGHGDIFSTSD